jgi:hypothetical protein
MIEVSKAHRRSLPKRPGAQATWRPSDLARFPTGWIHPVDKKSLQIQKLEHILVAQIEWF